MITVVDGLRSLVPRRICDEVEERILQKKVHKIKQLNQTNNPDQANNKDKSKKIILSEITTSLALHINNRRLFFDKLFNIIKDYIDVNKFILCRLYREVDNIQDKNSFLYNSLENFIHFLITATMNTMFHYNRNSCNEQKFDLNPDKFSRAEIVKPYNIEPDSHELKSGVDKIAGYHFKFRITQFEFLDHLKFLVRDYTDIEKLKLYSLYCDLEEKLDINLDCVDKLLEVINTYEDDIYWTIHMCEIYVDVITKLLAEHNLEDQFVPWQTDDILFKMMKRL